MDTRNVPRPPADASGSPWRSPARAISGVSPRLSRRGSRSRPRPPELHVAKNPDHEKLIALYRRLTGREPTPEEIERSRKILEGKTPTTEETDQ
jgi:hypothetical protein